MTTQDLKSNEFDPYYGRYIDKFSKTEHLRDGFKKGLVHIPQFFGSIPEERLSYRYAPGKWDCKEILQHLIDTEHIFMYRCFRIARNDQTALAGYDQNIYIDPSGAKDKSISALLTEYKATRTNSIVFLDSVTDIDLQNIGNANDGHMSARAAAFTLVGHEIWHMDTMREKYL